MFYSYSFSNYQSFAEHVEVNFTSGKKTQPTDFVVGLPDGDYVSKAMMTVGANASGKTSLIKPLAFIDWLLDRSFVEPADMFAFSPHPTKSEQPTTFTFTRDGAGALWRYSVTMTNLLILTEKLERRDSTSKKFQYAFKREWQKSEQKYTIKQQTGFHLPLKVLALLPKTVSFLSWARQYGNPLASQLLNEWATYSNVTPAGRLKLSLDILSDTARILDQEPLLLEQANALLRTWDLGLSSIEINKESVDSSGKQVFLPMGVHSLKNGGSFKLYFTSESEGTQAALLALVMIFPALQTGSLVAFDELEAHLHPHMIAPILKLFSSQETNPKNAQIIFTSHSLEAMNLLQKSQIMLVEKNDCSSDAWRLDDVEGVRTDDNFYAKYMAGAYAAIPNIE
jgi:hypothetical protein